MSLYEAIRYKGKIKRKYRTLVDKMIKREDISGYGNTTYGYYALSINKYDIDLLDSECNSVIEEEYESLFPWEPFKGCNKSGSNYESKWDIKTGELTFAIWYNYMGRVELDDYIVDLLKLISNRIDSFEAILEDNVTKKKLDNEQTTILYCNLANKNNLEWEVCYGESKNTRKT